MTSSDLNYLPKAFKYHHISDDEALVVLPHRNLWGHNSVHSHEWTYVPSAKLVMCFHFSPICCISFYFNPFYRTPAHLIPFHSTLVQQMPPWDPPVNPANCFIWLPLFSFYPFLSYLIPFDDQEQFLCFLPNFPPSLQLQLLWGSTGKALSNKLNSASDIPYGLREVTWTPSCCAPDNR